MYNMYDICDNKFSKKYTKKVVNVQFSCFLSTYSVVVYVIKFSQYHHK